MPLIYYKMHDTPQQIYDLQLKLWLAKPPVERLHQLMIDNEALFKFWSEVKPANKSTKKLLLTKTIIKSNFQK
ncbi:MAG: hypothetical protein ABI760_13430 [Ferruginibacter sp.]